MLTLIQSIFGNKGAAVEAAEKRESLERRFREKVEGPLTAHFHIVLSAALQEPHKDTGESFDDRLARYINIPLVLNGTAPNTLKEYFSLSGEFMVAAQAAAVKAIKASIEEFGRDRLNLHSTREKAVSHALDLFIEEMNQHAPLP